MYKVCLQQLLFTVFSYQQVDPSPKYFLQPPLNMSNTTASIYESFDSGMFSNGILLMAPVAKFTTTRQVAINWFSNASCMGRRKENSTPYIPAMINARPV